MIFTIGIKNPEPDWVRYTVAYAVQGVGREEYTEPITGFAYFTREDLEPGGTLLGNAETEDGVKNALFHIENFDPGEGAVCMWNEQPEQMECPKKKSWIEKHWKPVVGGTVGAIFLGVLIKKGTR